MDRLFGAIARIVRGAPRWRPPPQGVYTLDRLADAVGWRPAELATFHPRYAGRQSTLTRDELNGWRAYRSMVDAGAGGTQPPTGY